MVPNCVQSLWRTAPASRRLLVAVLLGTGLLLASTLACGDQAPLDSGIEGEVRIGPLSPVVSEGQDGDDAKPYSAVLRIKSIPEGQVVAETTSDLDGKFRVALAPGRYLVEPEQGDPLPIASTQEVTVEPGVFASIRIDYDSGIR
jgi:hypothetical protein